jgi:hypothetical protein
MKRRKKIIETHDLDCYLLKREYSQAHLQDQHNASCDWQWRMLIPPSHHSSLAPMPPALVQKNFWLAKEIAKRENSASMPFQDQTENLLYYHLLVDQILDVSSSNEPYI